MGDGIANTGIFVTKEQYFKGQEEMERRVTRLETYMKVLGAGIIVLVPTCLTTLVLVLLHV